MFVCGGIWFMVTGEHPQLSWGGCLVNQWRWLKRRTEISLVFFLTETEAQTLKTLEREGILHCGLQSEEPVNLTVIPIRAVPTPINASFLSVLKKAKWVRWRTKFTKRESTELETVSSWRNEVDASNETHRHEQIAVGKKRVKSIRLTCAAATRPLGSENFIIAKYLLSWTSYHCRRWFLVIIFSDVVALDFARGVYRWDCP